MPFTEHQMREAVDLGDDFLVGAIRPKKRPPYKPSVTRLERQLRDCAEGYDELWQDYADATGRQPPRYDDRRVIDVGARPATFIRYPNGGYRRVSAKEAAKYNLLSLAAKKLYQARHDPSCANISGRPSYRMVQTPGGITLRMASHLADQWRALSPAQQRSLLWRATRNRTTTQGRTLPCL